MNQMLNRFPITHPADWTEAERLCESANEVALRELENIGESMEESERVRPTGDVAITMDVDATRSTWYSIRDGVTGFSWSGWIRKNGDSHEIEETLPGEFDDDE